MPNLKILTAQTVARVRAGVVSALVCAATDLDETLRESLPAGRYSVGLSGPKGIRHTLSFREGCASEEAVFLPSLTLRFSSARAMAFGLGGGKGTVIPLPGGVSFLKALKGFMACSGRVGELTNQKIFANDAELALVTEMLMTAALRGVAETAMADPWTAVKAAQMPEGPVELCVAAIRGWIRRRGEVWESGRGAPPAEVNARLEFADMETAFGLFTGSVAALGALGRGTVSIRGRIPMIQLLFPLLDRFGEIMNWGKDEA